MSSKVGNPFTNPGSWDKLTLEGGAGGYTLPGIVKISYEAGLNEDSAPTPGQNGRNTTLLGYKPASFDVSVQVWTEEQFEELRRIVEIFRPKNDGAKAKAVLAIHPQIQFLGVKYVYITSITGGGYSPRDGYILNLKLEQFFEKTTGELVKPATPNPLKPKPKPKTKTVTTRSSSGAIPLDPDGKPTSKASGVDWAKTYKPPSATVPDPKKP